MNDYKLGFGMLIVACIGNYALAAVFEQAALPHVAILNPLLILVFIGARLFQVIIAIRSNYGFNHVRATTANVLLNLDLLISTVLGFLLYGELLTPLQLIGACSSSSVSVLEQCTQKSSSTKLPQ